MLMDESAPPTVSVLMPVYNAERYVAEAVESILAQTFTDFEFIIIDDGSTDGSLGILRDYAARDRRINLVSRENRGFSATLNEGLQVCRAELVARMDADDIALPDRLHHQVPFMRDHPEVSVCGTDIYWTDDNACLLRRERVRTSHDDIMAALRMSLVLGICHPTAILRKSIVNRLGGYRHELCPAEDQDLWFRCAEVSRLANISIPLLKYRMHSASMCGSSGDRLPAIGQLVVELHDERVRVGSDRLMRGEPVVVPRGIDSSEAGPSRHRTWAWWALGSGYVNTARKHAFATLRAAPFSPASWRVMACALRGY